MPHFREFFNAWNYLSSWTGSASLESYAKILMSQVVQERPTSSSSHRDASIPGGLRPLQKALNALSVDLGAILCVVARSDIARRTFREQVHGIEGVLVASLGHASIRVRSHSIKLLNSLYDCVDWQLAEPLQSTIAYVGDAFSIDIFTTDTLNSGSDAEGNAIDNARDNILTNPDMTSESFRILISAPPFDVPTYDSANGEETDTREQIRAGTPDCILTMHIPSSISAEEAFVDMPQSADDSDGFNSTSDSVSFNTHSSPADNPLLINVNTRGSIRKVKGTRIKLNLSSFTRCGFVDWRVVAVSPNGSTRPITALKTVAAPRNASVHEVDVLATPRPSPRNADVHMSEQAVNSLSPLAQGRYIVHRRNLTTELWHELIVDIEGIKFSEDGEIAKHGTFESVTAKLKHLKASGITSVYVLGAIERDNGWGEREPMGSAIGSTMPSPRHAEKNTQDLRATSEINDNDAHAMIDGDGGEENVRNRANSEDTTASDGGGLNNFGFFTLSHSNSPSPPEIQPLSDLPRSHHVPAFSFFRDTAGVPAPIAVKAPIQAMESDVLSSVAGYRAYSMRPDANPHAVVDRITPNRMLGGPAGLIHLVREAKALNMRVALQCDAAISASRPHRKYRDILARTLDIKGQAVVHAGSDGLENQWEDQQLLNYRRVETWDLLVSEAKTLVQNFGIGGLYLPDAQSYPFIMALDAGELLRRDVDGETHYSEKEMLQGEVVVANAEVGFWTTRAAKRYPNPILVKLTRALWSIAPDFTILGESHWGRSGALARSGVVPHALDLVSAIATTLGRCVDKNGISAHVNLPNDIQPIAQLRALLIGEAQGLAPPQVMPNFLERSSNGTFHTPREFPNPLNSLLESPGGAMPLGAQLLQLRSLSSARLPYPSLLLGRSAWTAADLLYTLPGIPCTFQDERHGRAYRADVAGTYRFNEHFLEEERKKNEQRQRAERHNRRWRAVTSSSGKGGENLVSAVASQNLRKQIENAPTQFPPQSFPNAYDSAFENYYEGHIGAGGVVPGPQRHGSGISPMVTARIRSGFSHMNLQEVASAAAGFATGSAFGGVRHSYVDSFDLNIDTSALGPVDARRPPTGSPLNGLGSKQLRMGGQPSSSGGFSPSQCQTLSQFSAPTLRSNASSLALQDLVFLENGIASADESITRNSGGLNSNDDFFDQNISVDDSNDGADDDDEEDDDFGLFKSRPRTDSGASNRANRLGFGLAGGVTAAHSLKGSAAVASTTTTSSSNKGVSTIVGTRSSHRGGSSNSSRDLSTSLRVQSWQAVEAPQPQAGPLLQESELHETFRTMQQMEANLRLEVGPEFGFDLSKIEGHYEHRGQCRRRFRVLREGAFTPLTAQHRFGEHGHVFAFARHVGGCVAVVACNFNGHPSTFAVDCTRIASAFGDATMSNASSSVVQLMASSTAYGEGLRARIERTIADNTSLSTEKPVLAVFEPLASLNLKGGVWEVRDVFQSDGNWTMRSHSRSQSIDRPATNDEAAASALASGFWPSQLTDDDGPLVAIVTAEEAAYAPMMKTLNPHRSYCWIYATSQSGSQIPSSSGYVLRDRDAETDPVAMQWLFASSLLRLQAMLRLKECGSLETAVITRAEVEMAGGVEKLRGRRESGKLKENWINPGEMLKDDEVQKKIRHNLIYSLLRNVVKNLLRALKEARAIGAEAGEPPIGFVFLPPSAGKKNSSSTSPVDIQTASENRARALVIKCAVMLEAALRVLVTHFCIRVGPVDKSTSSDSLPIFSPYDSTSAAENISPVSTPIQFLVAEPLPPLHRKASHLNEAAAVGSSPTIGGRSGTKDPGWHSIDPEVAVSLVRASLFLAVKDVVAQASSSSTRSPSSSSSPTSRSTGSFSNSSSSVPNSSSLGPADVSEDDAELAALLNRGLLHLARGLSGSVGSLIPAVSSLESSSLASTAALPSTPLPSSPPTKESPLVSKIAVERGVTAFARRLLLSNLIGPIVFVTPELGKWSTVGGLGVMVDELSVGLAELGADVTCISPYYNVNRKNESDYLKSDGISFSGRVVTVWVGGEKIDVGVHEGFVQSVRVLFLHNALVFPRPYPPHDAYHQVRMLTAFARATLETLCQLRLVPSLIITNDWFTGLVSAYARNPRFFGMTFYRTDFLHICHNLDPDYEGRVWPDKNQGSLQGLHELDPHLLVDPSWDKTVINPTRAALLCSDSWATVSRSYRADLLASSPLRAILELAPHPFAHPNGIPAKSREARLKKLPFANHEEAKAEIQKRYFGLERPDPTIPLFAFVGRITAQKGVHLILQSVEQVLRDFNYRCQFLVAGAASDSDTYGRQCANAMNDLRVRHPSLFWADPGLFFTDGALINLGADFCMMPSTFEPGGIVQQEFFIAGTPVIAFKTGGLKDTVLNWNPLTRTGTGFTFDHHNAGDFQLALRRALSVYHDTNGSYDQMRKNAHAAVMDLSVVSLAWFREFHRIRRCLPSPPQSPKELVRFSFSIKVSDNILLSPTSNVCVAGTFNKWLPQLFPLRYVPPIATLGESGSFEGSLILAPGTYMYKFVINGEWVLQSNQPHATDGVGNVNNIVTVVR
jgi:glycogen synthase